jgi:hypothetical protein
VAVNAATPADYGARAAFTAHESPCVKGCSGWRLAVKRCALCPAGSLR